MFAACDRYSHRCYGHLWRRYDVLGKRYLCGVGVWHVVLADVAVQCRQQHSAKYDEERCFQCVLHKRGYSQKFNDATPNISVISLTLACEHSRIGNR